MSFNQCLVQLSYRASYKYDQPSSLAAFEPY